MENNEIGLNFTEAENKIRKRWLFWSTILPAIALGICLIFCTFGFLVSLNYIAMMGILLFFPILAGGLYLNYHCAYKNSGTNLLVLTMVGISINLIFQFFNKESLEAVGVFSFLISMLMVHFFELIVFYYSYRMRKINKKMQRREGCTF